ncbi:MAG: outer membrane lipoprotein carrier protein LolA [Methylococcaceae bacterium]|nr:outer membrane lipoprotein carrier protein LolA [Methylococcaceae bacterium]
MSLLKQPLQVSGLLSFSPPAWLEKRITAPVDERYRVDGDRLTVDRPSGGLHQELSLSAYPPLWAFVESIRAPLAGDRATLERFYQVSLGGSRRNWLLALVPREPEMAALVRSVQIRGNEDRMRELTIEEANGDRSVLQIQWPR